MIPVLHGVWASGGSEPVGFDHLETQTVGAGGAATITFSSIPGTYKHLQMRGILRRSDNDVTATLRINGDSTAANYRDHRLGGDGANAFSQSFADNWTFIITGSGKGSDRFGAFVTDILDYTSTTKRKTVRTLTGYDDNGTGEINLFSVANYNETSAITSLVLACGAGSFVHYSSVSLYGVK